MKRKEENKFVEVSGLEKIAEWVLIIITLATFVTFFLMIVVF